MTIRIAMWSGPRNISTALMRSFEARGDCDVSDEPLYAAYLHETGLDHPGRAEILRSQPTDSSVVTDSLSTSGTQEHPIWYQKHMVHHLLPSMDREWMKSCHHVFLIRDPAAVIASYGAVRPDFSLEELGFIQQLEIFRWVQVHMEQSPWVIDSQDVLLNPAGVLSKVCHGLNIEYTDKMLCWPQGPRESDGVWAKYWYGNVQQSTGFKPYAQKKLVVEKRYEDLHARAYSAFEEMGRSRLI